MVYLLTKFDNFLNRSFYKLGNTIANHYGYFIIVPVFISAILATGIQRIRYEDDPEYLFSPTTGLAKVERAIIEENFFVNYSSDFHPSRITRMGRYARLIITAKDEATLLRTHIWEEIMSLNSLVHSINVLMENEEVGYNDLCAIWDSKCFENNVLDLHEFMPEIENGTFTLTYPFMLNPLTFEALVFPFFFGGVDVNSSGIMSVQALSVFYWLKTNTAKQQAEATLWEDALLEAVEKREFEFISVARFVSRTLEVELERNTHSVAPLYAVAVAILVVFSVCSVMMGDWVRSKPWLGFASIISATLACLAAYGFLIYLGVEFIGINMASPFLMLGIGIDNAFVMLAAWRRTKLQDSVQERMGQTMAESAVSITITSLTDMISFFVGAITPFPSVQIFCLYTGTAVLVSYVWHITFFGGCLALAGFMEKDRRHGFTCHTIKPKSEAVDDGCCYRYLCTGGLSDSDPMNSKDNKPHAFMMFFRDHVARYLNMPFIKALVILVLMTYLAVASYGFTMLREGLERRKLSRDDSYSVHFYDSEDRYFREYPYRIQVAVTGDVNYSDPVTQKELMELHNKFEKLSYSGGPIFTESWLRSWLAYTDRNQEYLGINITSEEDFCSHLGELYLAGPANVFAQDVTFNENKTRIVASRFIFQTHEILDTNADKDMMEAFRKVAFESRFNVTVFNPYFIFFDQFILVRTISIQAICLAAAIMVIISLVFIPNPVCSFWVAVSIMSIEVGVVGCMTLWGVNLDSISMINLIMCIGFSVDFSAHISYAYLAAKVDTPDERVQECLYALGVPIVQGALSTILAISALLLAPSYIFITFFKTVFLVIFFGAMHGILLLPVLLSLMGPGSCNRKKLVDSPAPSVTYSNSFFAHNENISSSDFVDLNIKIPRAHYVRSVRNGSAASQVNLTTQTGFDTLAASEGGNSQGKDSLDTNSEESKESIQNKGLETQRRSSGSANRTRKCPGLPFSEAYDNKGYVNDSMEDNRRAQESDLPIYGEWEEPRQCYSEQISSFDYSCAQRRGSAGTLDQESDDQSHELEAHVHHGGSSVPQHEQHSSQPGDNPVITSNNVTLK
ncbi:patched domain-containing protein 3-like [Cherax quadricarinatus]|uniref:patched domain-containing protein 3-like n=1 Tax=Cherax quadricarinatus TaxID=27406 RepID=UPI00387E3DD5